MARKALPPELAADLEVDAREGARLTRLFREIDRAWERTPHRPTQDYPPQWYAANRVCWRYSGAMIDKYGLFEHWTTYYAAQKRYLEEEEQA